jgi:hypothetical protein
MEMPMIQGFMPPDISQQRQLSMPGVEQAQPEQNALAKLLEQMRADKEQAKAMQEKKDTASLQGAGIQAGATLLGGLLAQKAQAEMAQKQSELESNKAVAETSAKGAQTAAQAQQDAFTKLLGSMRAGMVK